MCPLWRPRERDAQSGEDQPASGRRYSGPGGANGGLVSVRASHPQRPALLTWSGQCIASPVRASSANALKATSSIARTASSSASGSVASTSFRQLSAVSMVMVPSAAFGVRGVPTRRWRPACRHRQLVAGTRFTRVSPRANFSRPTPGQRRSVSWPGCDLAIPATTRPSRHRPDKQVKTGCCPSDPAVECRRWPKLLAQVSHRRWSSPP